MHIFQFEEEDAMQKAIALSLAIEKTKVDIVPAVEVTLKKCIVTCTISACTNSFNFFNLGVLDD